MKRVVPFAKARETSLYGAKAVGLGDAARRGLSVPPGVALSGALEKTVEVLLRYLPDERLKRAS